QRAPARRRRRRHAVPAGADHRDPPVAALRPPRVPAPVRRARRLLRSRRAAADRRLRAWGARPAVDRVALRTAGGEDVREAGRPRLDSEADRALLRRAVAGVAHPPVRPRHADRPDLPGARRAGATARRLPGAERPHGPVLVRLTRAGRGDHPFGGRGRWSAASMPSPVLRRTFLGSWLVCAAVAGACGGATPKQDASTTHATAPGPVAVAAPAPVATTAAATTTAAAPPRAAPAPTTTGTAARPAVITPDMIRADSPYLFHAYVKVDQGHGGGFQDVSNEWYGPGNRAFRAEVLPLFGDGSEDPYVYA